jgi:hypothetical protein
MKKKDSIGQDIQQSAISKEELEQHLRARAWKDDTFRQELLANPKAVLQRDFAAWFPEGKIPSELTIKVVEEEEQSICFVLPTQGPKDGLSDPEALDDDELQAVVGAATQKWQTCITCPIVNTCRCDLRGLKIRL